MNEVSSGPRGERRLKEVIMRPRVVTTRVGTVAFRSAKGRLALSNRVQASIDFGSLSAFSPFRRAKCDGRNWPRPGAIRAYVAFTFAASSRNLSSERIARAESPGRFATR